MSLETTFDAGAVLFEEGQDSREMYILTQGKVEILQDEIRVAIVSDPGSYLGEMSTLLGAPRSATARTLAPSRLIVVAPDKVHAFLSHSPNLGEKLARLLATRLRETTDDLSDAREVADHLGQIVKKFLVDIEEAARKEPAIAPIREHLMAALREARTSLRPPRSQHQTAPPAPPAEPAAPGQPAAASGERHSSILVKDLRCFLHPTGDAFGGHVLKANTQVVEPNIFDIPVYRGAVPDREAVNFLLHEVTICPRCYFASNDIHHFLDRKNSQQTRPPEFTPKALRGLEADKEERAKMVQATGPALYTLPRTPVVAMTSWLLAARSADALFRAVGSTQPIWGARTANHYLRAAQLAVEMDDEAREENLLQKALDYLDKAYGSISGPTLYKVLFQLMVLHLHFGAEDRASKMLSSFRKMEADPAMAESEKVAMSQYLNRAKKAWEDREYLARPRILQDRKGGEKPTEAEEEAAS